MPQRQRLGVDLGRADKRPVFEIDQAGAPIIAPQMQRACAVAQAHRLQQFDDAEFLEAAS